MEKHKKIIKSPIAHKINLNIHNTLKEKQNIQLYNMIQEDKKNIIKRTQSNMF